MGGSPRQNGAAERLARACERHADSLRRAERRQAEAVGAAERRLAAAVGRARSDGLSVAQVAEVLGFKTRKAVYDLLRRAEQVQNGPAPGGPGSDKGGVPDAE